MNKWLMRLRGAIGMGLTWAVGGAFVGGMIELTWNLWPGFPIGPLVDMWPQTLAIPGFLAGLVFSGVLGLAGRNRRFDELSLPRFAAWGAVGGLLASLAPVAVVALGLGSPNVPVWQITVALAGPLALGSAIAASGSLLLARMAEEPEPLDAAPDAAELELTETETRELLGDGA